MITVLLTQTKNFGAMEGWSVVWCNFMEVIMDGS